MQIQIEKMDQLGNGIGYFNNKIVFIPKTIPGDIIHFKIIKETKNYINGIVIEYLKRGNCLQKAFCPYYDKCGGCHLQNFSYEDSLKYKKERVLNILNKIELPQDINIVANINEKNYRNKIQLKVKNKLIGFYEENTHNIIQIDKCLITKNCINNFIPILKTFNIINGDILIRCNYNEELLIAINTKDNITINKGNLPNYKVVGIILNDNVVYGDNKFIEIINNTFFEVSYNAFFQVNNYINEKLFNIILENVKGNNVLDLYSGVGTLSIMASKNAKKVYAIENIPNAVLNALKNSKMNNITNINFILGNTEDKIGLINDQIDVIIVDPPRKGLDKKTIDKILNLAPEKIIYISCDTHSLANNLKDLTQKYQLTKLTILDMFSYTYHVECVCVLKLK